MNEIKWYDRFNLGVESIDKAHQRLFSIVGKLIAFNEDEAKQQHACREGIKYLKSYAVKHFADEEKYMKSIGYAGFDIHKRLHDNMRDKTIPALERELEEYDYSAESVRHFLGICIGWLQGHIMIEDFALTGRMPNKWVHQPSEDEVTSLEKAVIQTSQELFRLDAQLVSEHYSGEDFAMGKMLCFRMNYLTAEGKRAQAFMIYEQDMVLRMLSQIVGRQIKIADKTVLYAIKALSEQFVARVGTHFLINRGCKLEKHDMLTFEQLLRAFDKEYPPYSLLFSADQKGYFAICARYSR